jgi:hypothetical protein
VNVNGVSSPFHMSAVQLEPLGYESIRNRAPSLLAPPPTAFFPPGQVADVGSEYSSTGTAADVAVTIS